MYVVVYSSFYTPYKQMHEYRTYGMNAVESAGCHAECTDMPHYVRASAALFVCCATLHVEALPRLRSSPSALSLPIDAPLSQGSTHTQQCGLPCRCTHARLRGGHAGDAGWLSVLPAVVALGASVVLKQVIIALMLGVWTGCMVLHRGKPALSLLRVFDRYMVRALADAEHAGVLLFTLLLGGSASPAALRTRRRTMHAPCRLAHRAILLTRLPRAIHSDRHRAAIRRRPGLGAAAVLVHDIRHQRPGISVGPLLHDLL